MPRPGSLSHPTLDHGGTFRFLTPSGEVAGTQAYIRNTNVLVTTFATDEAAWEIVDFAPRIPSGLDVMAPLQIVRLVRPLR